MQSPGSDSDGEPDWLSEASAHLASLPSCSGWLEKKSGGKNGHSKAKILERWDKRWFMLRGSQLVYYKTEDAAKLGKAPAGSIDCAGADFFLKDVKGSVYRFTVVSHERELKLRAATASTYEMWTQAIRPYVATVGRDREESTVGESMRVDDADAAGRGKEKRPSFLDGLVAAIQLPPKAKDHEQQGGSESSVQSESSPVKPVSGLSAHKRGSVFDSLLGTVQETFNAAGGAVQETWTAAGGAIQGAIGLKSSSNEGEPSDGACAAVGEESMAGAAQASLSPEEQNAVALQEGLAYDVPADFGGMPADFGGTLPVEDAEPPPLEHRKSLDALFEAYEPPVGLDEAYEPPVGLDEAYEPPVGLDEAYETPVGLDGAVDANAEADTLPSASCAATDASGSGLLAAEPAHPAPPPLEHRSSLDSLFETYEPPTLDSALDAPADGTVAAASSRPTMTGESAAAVAAPTLKLAGGGTLTAGGPTARLAPFKIIIVGDSGVGKTSLLVRFAEGRYEGNEKPTISVDVVSSQIELGASTVGLSLWDTAGQERYAPLAAPFFRQADGVILVFDVGSRKTFDRLANHWQGEIERKASVDVNIMLVGAKADLPAESRMVEPTEARAFAQERGWDYFETSAKSGVHVRDAFYLLACNVMNRLLEDDPKNLINEPAVTLSAKRGKRSVCC